MSDYELINPPAFTKKSCTEKFIYVLMFGNPGLPLAPYYIGQTSGLTDRFGSHSLLVWHHAEFGTAAGIWVAGSVRTMDADLAEQDLITRLSDAGHLLANTAITHGRVKKVQTVAGLRAMGAQQVCAHLRSTPKRRGMLTGWTDKWCCTPRVRHTGNPADLRADDQIREHIEVLEPGGRQAEPRHRAGA